MSSQAGDLGRLAQPPIFVVGVHRAGTTWAYEFRRRGVSEWRSRFGFLDRLRFDRSAGPMLVELGYEANRRWWIAPGQD